MKKFRIFTATEAKNGFRKLLRMTGDPDTVVVVVNAANDTYYQVSPLSVEYKDVAADSSSSADRPNRCQICHKRLPAANGLGIHAARQHHGRAAMSTS